MFLVASSRDMKLNGYNVVIAAPLHLLGTAVITYTWFYAWNAYPSGVVAIATGLKLRKADSE